MTAPPTSRQTAVQRVAALSRVLRAGKVAAMAAARRPSPPGTSHPFRAYVIVRVQGMPAVSVEIARQMADVQLQKVYLGVRFFRLIVPMPDTQRHDDRLGSAQAVRDAMTAQHEAKPVDGLTITLEQVAR